ncbi:MAG: histidine triad nucleotide-binding protein [Endomicrobiia bacterium]|nr:histidine triad nucleotide-binding protein [Endomicrobiia bacterium]
MSCIFCRIVSGAVPSDKVYEDDKVFAFRDISPQAPVHILIVPKKHVAGLNELSDEDGDVVAALVAVAGKIASSSGLKNGWRLVANTGPDAGQTMDHLHFHILGGRKLTWPPG